MHFTIGMRNSALKLQKSAAIQADWKEKLYHFIECSICPTDLEKEQQ